MNSEKGAIKNELYMSCNLCWGAVGDFVHPNNTG